MKKGQVTLAIAIISAIGIVGASVASGWFAGGRRVAEVEKDVAVIEERENNHYEELVKFLERIEKKLDDNHLLVKKEQ